jgi:hypothetical protein
MEGAKGHLKFFEMDLLNSDSIAAAVKGCAGVIHLACPNIIGEVKDPEVPKSKLLNTKKKNERTNMSATFIHFDTHLPPSQLTHIKSQTAIGFQLV